MPQIAGSDGALAKAFGGRAPKTRKGRKILKEKEPQAVEGAKTALIIRGNKGSHDVSMLLQDLHRLRSPLSQLHSRTHDMHPFEDVTKLETACNKADHGLFAFGSSSKKRPCRLILGRLFNSRLLDMQEFKVDNFKCINSFPTLKRAPVCGSKPLMLFQGSSFETDDRLKRVKSLMLDFFGGEAPSKVLLEGLEHVIVFSASEEPVVGSADETKVSMRRFSIQYAKSGSKLPRCELQEAGPSFDLHFDRCKEADRDQWKKAIKVPKEVKPKKVKNIKTVETGNTKGNIHLGKQDFDQIHTVHHGKAKEKRLRSHLDNVALKKRKLGDP